MILNAHDDSTTFVITVSHTLKLRQGGQIPKMIQLCDWYILIVHVELNTLIYVRPLN